MKTLVDTCHAAGIKVVLDIVCNHSSPDINGTKGLVLDDGKPIADFNNDSNGFYYHEGEISDWEDEYQLIHLEMMGLATFNEKNIDYRNYIKSAIRTWLDAGVDALRVDTLKHMPIWFWQEFTTAMKAYKPGLFMFGEYGFSKPWEQRSVDYANNIGMSILDFGLCDGIRFCFSGQEPGGFHQVERVLAYDKVYHKANELVTFIDNHDMPRFLSIVPDQKKLDLALVMLLTIRGVPCLFYGTEQYLNNATDGGQDPYNRPMMDRWDTQAHPYQLVRKLLQLRSSNQALAFGSHQTAWVNDDFYLYTRNFRDSAVMVMVNKSESDHVVNAENIHMPNGVYSCLLTGYPVEIVNGCLQGYTVPGNTALVISVDGKPVEAPLVAVFQINGFETQPGQSLAIIGDCDELGNWDHANSYGMEFLNENTWIATVGFSPTQPKVINFKFIVHDSNGEPIVEYLINRKSVLPREGRIAIDCFWNSAN
jgi:cyclomaltodextrin glucanotransferase